MADVKVNIIAEDNFSSTLGNFGSIMTGIESVINLATKAFNALVVPVIEFGKESVLAAARVEELAAVNVILAENAGIPAESIPPLVEAIRAQGIEAGIAQTTVANLIRANIDLSLATDLARVAQDAAVISGMNSSETLDNIIYGITTLNPLVLRHAGIIVDLQLAYKEWAEENGRTVESLTTAEKQQIAMNEVLEAGADIAGAYAAAMEEPGKVLRSFPRYFDDIKVAIGEPFQEAFGEALFAVADLTKWIGTAVQEGGDLRPLLDLIAEGAGVLADKFVTLIQRFQEFVESGGLIPIVDALKQGVDIQDVMIWLDELDAILAEAVSNYDWISLGDAFGESILKAFTGGIETKSSEFIPALGKAISDFFRGAIGEVWYQNSAQDLAAGFVNLVIRTIKDNFATSVQWTRDIASNIVTSLLSSIQGNFLASVTWLKNIINQYIINPIKDILGISSPSTVFMEFGRNIIQGLIAGILSMVGTLLSFIVGIVNLLMAPFEPLLELLGIDTTGAGSTGGRGTGSTSPGGTGTLTTGTQNYYNYYYGPVYFQGTGQTNGGVDCQSPNPVLSATGSSLPSMGVA